MSIISTIKGWLSVLLRSRAKDEFNIEPITSAQLDSWVQECINIYRGEPCWLSESDNIDTVNFAKSVCSEIAKLTTLKIGITVDGSARAGWIQTKINSIRSQLRDWVEYGCAYGTVILKPNGNNIDLYTYEDFEVTNSTGNVIDGVVFTNRKRVGDKYYTRLEYHRFDGDAYRITNRCFVGESPNDTKKAIDIKLTPWAELAEDVSILNVDRPLFGVFRTPQANNIDIGSAVGLPVFSEAVQELQDLDIAYSRNSKEIKDSKRTVLLDSDVMLPGGGKPVAKNPMALKHQRDVMELPDYIRNVTGDGTKAFYQEINPTLNTETRIAGINALLSQIGYKAGFSNGHFVFNEKTGRVTAREVESDDARTIQTINDHREKLQNCVDCLIYALDVFATLYNLAPAGRYKTNYDFADITYNLEDDKTRWISFVNSGRVAFWRYLVMFEGYSEEDAKAIEQEAQPKTPTLFGGE